MRILHVNKFLYRRGGAEGYMEDVAALQEDAGNVVGFWGMAHPENTMLDLADTFASEVDFETPPAGVAARGRMVARMVWSPSARKGIDRAIERFRPDVAHLHNVYHQLSPSILGPLVRHGVPVVMTLHDYKLVCPTYQLLDHGQLCEACLPHRFYEAPKRRCRNDSLLASASMAADLSIHTLLRSYKGVRIFICPSRFLAGKMSDGKVYPERLRVLRHFVDLDGYRLKESPGGGVLVAGRLSPEKGIDVAIRAAAQFPDGITLHVAGDGPSRGELEALASQAAPGRVVFHGRLPKAELHDLLRSCLAAAVPSVWHENQPMAVLEAMGCGVPVIGTTLGGVPELVEPGRTGELVAPGDPAALAAAVASLASDPQRALEMGWAGRNVVAADFTPSRHLDELSSLYAEAGAPA
jgi:glycosyltransferase involved in cell wall biosynthesis